MPRKKRTSREEIDKSEFDLSRPIPIKELGSKGDPCFGKHHDLVAPECRVCGDAEYCQIAKSQNLRIASHEMVKDQRFKDVEEAERSQNIKLKEAEIFALDLIDKGLRKTKIVLRTSQKFNLDRKTTRELINKILE